MTLVEDRHGPGWICFEVDPGDLPRGLNGGYREHMDAMRSRMPFPMGYGATRAEAIDSFRAEKARFKAQRRAYRCCLWDLR